MKKNRKYRVLSLRYLEISVDDEGNEMPVNTTMRRVFIAKNKKGLVEKLKSFEHKMLSKKKPTNLFAKMRSSIECFSRKCKRFHMEAMRL